MVIYRFTMVESVKNHLLQIKSWEVIPKPTKVEGLLTSRKKKVAFGPVQAAIGGSEMIEIELTPKNHDLDPPIFRGLKLFLQGLESWSWKWRKVNRITWNWNHKMWRTLGRALKFEDTKKNVLSSWKIRIIISLLSRCVSLELKELSSKHTNATTLWGWTWLPSCSGKTPKLQWGCQIMIPSLPVIPAGVWSFGWEFWVRIPPNPRCLEAQGMCFWPSFELQTVHEALILKP